MKRELKQLIINLKNKIDKNLLEILLETQAEVIRNSNNAFAHKQILKVKEKMQEKLSIRELQSILTKQKEITELENQLTDLKIQQYEVQIEQPPK